VHDYSDRLLDPPSERRVLSRASTLDKPTIYGCRWTAQTGSSASPNARNAERPRAPLRSGG